MAEGNRSSRTRRPISSGGIPGDDKDQVSGAAAHIEGRAGGIE